LDKEGIQAMNLDQVIAYAEEVVKEQSPDFRYSEEWGDTAFACFYVPSTDPRFPGLADSNDDRSIAPGAAVTGCGVGRILDRAGLMTDAIAGTRKTIGHLIDDCEVAGIEHGTDVHWFLSEFQQEQDTGATWPEALASAKKTVGR
jgi:hypothetical protein